MYFERNKLHVGEVYLKENGNGCIEVTVYHERGNYRVNDSRNGVDGFDGLSFDFIDKIKQEIVDCVFIVFVFFFKQKTAYEISECDWSSDVCSSDLKQKTAYEFLNVTGVQTCALPISCTKPVPSRK